MHLKMAWNYRDPAQDFLLRSCCHLGVTADRGLWWPLRRKGLLAYDSDESIVLHQRGVFGGLVFGHGTRGSGASARAGGQRGGAGTGLSMVTGRGRGTLLPGAWARVAGEQLRWCVRLSMVVREARAMGNCE